MISAQSEYSHLSLLKKNVESGSDAKIKAKNKI
jgi:hypothetical protein